MFANMIAEIAEPASSFDADHVSEWVISGEMSIEDAAQRVSSLDELAELADVFYERFDREDLANLVCELCDDKI